MRTRACERFLKVCSISGAEAKAISLLVGLGFSQDMLHMPVKSFRCVFLPALSISPALSCRQLSLFLLFLLVSLADFHVASQWWVEDACSTCSGALR
jgi:hypothetical protein